jgi:predicted RNA binding protein YcfA (HicA-like mRNA interferase family)
MGKKEKLLIKARNNPAGLAFSDFETLLSQSGWIFDHQSGSHRIWYSPRKHRLPSQPKKDGKAKAYQVKQFIEQYEKEVDNG